MTVEGVRHPAAPRMTVVGANTGSQASTSWWQAMSDGTAAVGLGGMIAGGFLIEAGKSVMTGEATGRWWFVLGSAFGLAIICVGLWQRQRLRNGLQIGLVVTATDTRRDGASGKRHDKQAENYSLSTCSLTLKTSVELADAGHQARELVEALADETLTTITIAERLSPDAARINLIPTMPLHVAFYFGARMRQTHAREIVVHAIRLNDGNPSYFPATSLRVMESDIRPLRAERLDHLDGDPTRAAIAVDLQGRGDQFFDPVVHTCREHDVGLLLRVRSDGPLLAPDLKTFSGAVEQIYDAWATAPLPTTARTGRHAIFLSGPVAIALALGARLAGADQGRWTAFSFNSASSTYEAFPPLADAEKRYENGSR
ncbi:SAVED domain-containing protein [Nonomuraea sp. B1E8]|uniref:SAVED domain-containing protein n=1 Tax=unclassified Nonomuraea TaxID=2593643 RepID=UPI00325E8920